MVSNFLRTQNLSFYSGVMRIDAFPSSNTIVLISQLVKFYAKLPVGVAFFLSAATPQPCNDISNNSSPCVVKPRTNSSTSQKCYVHRTSRMGTYVLINENCYKLGFSSVALAMASFLPSSMAPSFHGRSTVL